MGRSQLYPPSVDPGFPVLPTCPPGWAEVTFGEVFEVQHRPVALDPDRTYRLIVARRNRGGIELRGEFAGSEVLTKSQFEVHEGDFLISRRQIIHGACGIVPAALHGAVVSGEYSALRAKPAQLMDYYRHFSHAPYFQRTCFHSSHGVDVEKMVFKVDDWLARPVQTPPLGEQRKIAAILSSVDEAIEKTQAVIDQVQVVKKGLMQELLTKGMPGRHKTFKQTEIGEVPSGWEIKRLEEVAVVSSGGTPSRTEPAYWGGDIPWVKTGEVNYRAIRETEEYLTSRGVEESAAKLLPPGTVLMAMYGQGRTRGRVAWLEVSATANQACAAIESDDAMSVRFVYHVLSSMYESIRSIGNEGSQKNLNLGLIKQVRIPVPSTEEQREIGAIMDAIDNRGESESRLLKACQQLKSALATLLLTGTLRVPLPSEPA